MGKLKVCAALAAAAVLLAGPARGRDVGKGRGGDEEVAVDLKPVYRALRVLQLERQIAATLKAATLGEDEPLVQEFRRRLKEAREEAPPAASVCWEVARQQARQQAVKELADKVWEIEQGIAASLKIATRGEDEPAIQALRQQLKEAREELAKERKRVRPGK